jgi:hypothetical protein
MDAKEENRNLAILIDNFQGHRNSDWITIARVCKKLKDFYGSDSKLGEKVGKTREHIREILKLLDLTPELQKAVKNNSLNKEVAWRIAGVDGKKNQLKLAKAVKGMNAHDGRELVYYFARDPQISLDEYRKKILNAKNKIENIRVIVLPLSEDKFAKLNAIAKNRNKTPQKLILELIDSKLTGGK